MTAARPLISKYWLGTNSLFKDQETWMAIDATIWLDWTGGPFFPFSDVLITMNYIRSSILEIGGQQGTCECQVAYMCSFSVSPFWTLLSSDLNTHTQTHNTTQRNTPVCKKSQFCLWVYAWPFSFILHSCLTIPELQNYLNTSSTVQVKPL